MSEAIFAHDPRERERAKRRREMDENDGTTTATHDAGRTVRCLDCGNETSAALAESFAHGPTAAHAPLCGSCNYARFEDALPSGKLVSLRRETAHDENGRFAAGTCRSSGERFDPEERYNLFKEWLEEKSRDIHIDRFIICHKTPLRYSRYLQKRVYERTAVEPGDGTMYDKATM